MQSADQKTWSARKSEREREREIEREGVRETEKVRESRFLELQRETKDSRDH